MFVYYRRSRNPSLVYPRADSGARDASRGCIPCAEGRSETYISTRKPQKLTCNDSSNAQTRYGPALSARSGAAARNGPELIHTPGASHPPRVHFLHPSEALCTHRKRASAGVRTSSGRLQRKLAPRAEAAHAKTRPAQLHFSPYASCCSDATKSGSRRAHLRGRSGRKRGQPPMGGTDVRFGIGWKHTRIGPCVGGSSAASDAQPDESSLSRYSKEALARVE